MPRLTGLVTFTPMSWLCSKQPISLVNHVVAGGHNRRNIDIERKLSLYRSLLKVGNFSFLSVKISKDPSGKIPQDTLP